MWDQPSAGTKKCRIWQCELTAHPTHQITQPNCLPYVYTCAAWWVAPTTCPAALHEHQHTGIIVLQCPSCCMNKGRAHAAAADTVLRIETLYQGCKSLLCHIRVAVVKVFPQDLAPHRLIVGALHTAADRQHGTDVSGE